MRKSFALNLHISYVAIRIVTFQLFGGFGLTNPAVGETSLSVGFGLVYGIFRAADRSLNVPFSSLLRTAKTLRRINTEDF